FGFPNPAAPTKFFEGPCGVAVRPDGGIYVPDYYHHKIVSFGSSGGYASEAGNANFSDGPFRLALLGHRRLAANPYDNGVFALSYPSKVGWTIEPGVDHGEATGVAYDPVSDSLYVDARTYVAVYDVSGAHPVETMRIGEGNLVDAYGVAVSEHP